MLRNQCAELFGGRTTPAIKWLGQAACECEILRNPLRYVDSCSLFSKSLASLVRLLPSQLSVCTPGLGESRTCARNVLSSYLHHVFMSKSLPLRVVISFYRRVSSSVTTSSPVSPVSNPAVSLLASLSKIAGSSSRCVAHRGLFDLFCTVVSLY